MKIREIIKANKLCSEVNRIKKCSCITVNFINNEGKYDETQLTITHNPLTKAGTIELESLFDSLCKELNAKPDSITVLTIVASADTMEQLENMGY